MKLDLDLMRQIMLEIEKLPAGVIAQNFRLDGAEHFVVLEHLRLLHEEGYFDGCIVPGKNGQPLQAAVTRLTMKGHEFVRNAHNDTLWKKVTSDAQAKGSSVGLALLNRLLEKAAEKWLGLE